MALSGRSAGPCAGIDGGASVLLTWLDDAVLAGRADPVAAPGGSLTSAARGPGVCMAGAGVGAGVRRFMVEDRLATRGTAPTGVDSAGAGASSYGACTAGLSIQMTLAAASRGST